MEIHVETAIDRAQTWAIRHGADMAETLGGARLLGYDGEEFLGDEVPEDDVRIADLRVGGAGAVWRPRGPRRGRGLGGGPVGREAELARDLGGRLGDEDEEDAADLREVQLTWNARRRPRGAQENELEAVASAAVADGDLMTSFAPSAAHQTPGQSTSAPTAASECADGALARAAAVAESNVRNAGRSTTGTALDVDGVSRGHRDLEHAQSLLAHV